MKKRRIIIICSIVAVVIILIGTLSALFNLRNVSIEVLKNSEIVESRVLASDEDIIKSADFNYGSNMLFTSYEENQAKIEKAFPYLKVEKMVRKFPNKMTIYVSGRVPEVIVEDKNDSNMWYVLDIDMKVLDVLTSSSQLGDELYRDLPIVHGAEFETLVEGSFVDDTESAKCLVGVLDGIFGKNQSPSSVMSDITVDLSNKKLVVVLNDRDNEAGAKILISGFDYIKEKVYAAYFLYDSTFEDDDINYEFKSDLEFEVGANFVPGMNERVFVRYQGEEV
ncbi:MAG: FtsQ-type POTRA domain-containing protein [Clostridia bacterium]|nr:FtsQ-type POTRA domain-containing protein [Clostridia bacterium]